MLVGCGLYLVVLKFIDYDIHTIILFHSHSTYTHICRTVGMYKASEIERIIICNTRNLTEFCLFVFFSLVPLTYASI